jgi:hypothetical protein
MVRRNRSDVRRFTFDPRRDILPVGSTRGNPDPLRPAASNTVTGRRWLRSFPFGLEGPP